MASWIAKPWIEQALKSTDAKSLPKIARAQIIKLEEASTNVALISDKKLFVKAAFSENAIEQFKCDNSSLSLSDIQGGLIFIKKYSVKVTAEKELGEAEFMIDIQHFKFAGGEGNTQFGSDITDVSTYPPLQQRLRELWRLAQLRKHFDQEGPCQELNGDGSACNYYQIEKAILKSHENVFVPDDMERKLAEIPEWKPNYYPPQSCDMESGLSSFGSVASIGPQETRPSSSFVAAEDKLSLELNKKHVDCPVFSVTFEGRVGNVLSEDEIGAKTGALSNVTKYCCKAYEQLESTGLSSQTENLASSSHCSIKQPLAEESLSRGRTTVVSTEVSGPSTVGDSAAVTPTVVSSFGSSSLVPSNIQNPVDVSLSTFESKQEQTGSNCVQKLVLAEMCNFCDPEKGRGPVLISDKNKISKYRDDEVMLSQQISPVVERSGILEHEAKGNENKKLKSTCALQEETSTLASSRSSYVPSSQKHVVIIHPLKGLMPEELCLSSSEGSQLRGSSEESYSILQGGSDTSEKVAVTFVPSSQNSDEFEPDQPLPLVTPERSQHHCSLTESQLENLFENSVSFDEALTLPNKERILYPIQEEYTKIKPKNTPQGRSTPCENFSDSQKSSSESSLSLRTVIDQPCFSSSQEADSVPIKSISEENSQCNEVTYTKETALLSPSKNSVNHALNSKQIIRVNTDVDFDALFSQSTWKVSQTSTQEFSADLYEIDRRQSIKRKRSETDERSHKSCLLDVNKQENKVLSRDSSTSPDSTSFSANSHSGSSQSQLSNNSPTISLAKPVDLYSQQDPLVLETSGSAESNEGSAEEEPCSLRTPTFDSLPSFQIPAIAEKGQTLNQEGEVTQCHPCGTP